MAKKYEFKIPEPRGLGARVPKNFVSYNPMKLKPTDENQKAPTPGQAVPMRYRQAGGC